MAATRDGDNQAGSTPIEDGRHPYGPRPLHALLPRLLRPAFRRRSPAAARILLDWEAIVGPALAAAATPRRLSAGVLTLAAVGPAALELQHLSAQLAERINTYLGSAAVSRIRLVQERHAPPPARPPPVPAAGPPPPLEGLAEGPLREALQRLGQRVLTARR